MSKSVNLTVIMNDELKLKKILIEWNETGIDSNEDLLLGIANAIIDNDRMNRAGKKALDILNE